MQFVFDDGRTRHEVEVVLHDPDAVRRRSRVRPRGRTPARSPPRRRRPPGARPPPGRPSRHRPRRRWSACRKDRTTGAPRRGTGMRRVVGHRDTGGVDRRDRWSRRRAWLDLFPGSWTIGRQRSHLRIDDPTVSANHARLDVSADGVVTITDQSSLNGTWLDDEPLTQPAALEAGHGRSGSAPRNSPWCRCPTPGRHRSHTGFRERAAPCRSTDPRARHRPPDHEPLDPPRPPATGPWPRSGGARGRRGAPRVRCGDGAGVPQLALRHVRPAQPRRAGRRSAWRRDAGATGADVASVSATSGTLRRSPQRLAGLAADERAERLERLPSPAEIVRRSTTTGSRLWERRPAHDDFLHLRAGLGSVLWDPPVPGERRRLDGPVREVVAATSRLARAPVDVDLSGGGVVGVVGHRTGAVGLARSLVLQAATAHGPADLAVAVLVAPHRIADWDWVKWLPHVLDPRRQRSPPAGRRSRPGRRAAPSAARAGVDAAGRRRRRGPEPPTLLMVLDDESLTEGRRSLARSVLRGSAGPVAAIVVARSDDRLPAACTTVIDVVDRDGERGGPLAGDRRTGRRRHGVRDGRPHGPTGRSGPCPLRRSRTDVAIGSGVPAAVRLLPLLGLDPPTPEGVIASWSAAGGDPDLMAPRRRDPGRRAATSTSWATGPMAWSPGRRGPARASCCGPWSPPWPLATRPTW